LVTVRSITISFGHSQSPNYDAAVALARKADDYESMGDEHVARYTFEHLPAAERLAGMVRNWKTTSLACNGEELPASEFYKIRHIYKCWCRARAMPRTDVFCRGFHDVRRLPQDLVYRAMSQCRQFHLGGRGFSWLDYGEMKEDLLLHLDKDLLKQLVDNEMHRTRAYACPLFDLGRLGESIEGLPEAVDPDVFLVMR